MLCDLTPSRGYPSPAGRSTFLLVGLVMLMLGCGSGRKPARAVAPSHWNEIEASAGKRPPARSYTGMAFDSDRAKVIIFGGGASGGPVADLWEWDSATATWADRTPVPLPASWPARRVVPAVAYDEHRKRLVLFGGYLGDRDSGGRPYGDTWEWNPVTGEWTDVTPPSGAPTPSPRLAAACVYDESRRRVFLWGGMLRAALVGSAALASGCSDLAESLPPPDAGADSSTNPGVVEPPDPPGPSPWVRRSAAVSPSARVGHGLAYDPVRRKVVLFGGYSTKTLRDLWEWDGETGYLDRPNPVGRARRLAVPADGSPGLHRRARRIGRVS